MAVLNLLGFLVSSTDRYQTLAHRRFAVGLTAVIKLVVGAVTPLAFILALSLVWNYDRFKILNSPIWTSSQWTLIALTLWCIAEISFYIHCHNLRAKFSKHKPYSKLSQSERLHYQNRVLDHNPTPYHSLAKWFREPEKVGLPEIEDWLSWAFFNKLRRDLDTSEAIELNEVVAIGLQRDGSFPLDRVRADADGELRTTFMKLHMDPIRFQHKPLVAYLVISAMQLYGSVFLYVTGFQHRSCPTKSSVLSYYIYDPTNRQHQFANNNTDKPPVFLVHGIGIGITMYSKLINAIRLNDPARTIIVLDLPHISLKLVSEIPSMEETLTAIDYIFKKHRLTSCSWLGHSYGSIVTAWVVKDRPKYVQKVCLVDPVCFALWEPDLIRNFLYNFKPKGPIHHLAQFFVAKDLLVASTLFRNFWWLQNILFPEDLTCLTHIFYSRHDWIIDSEAMYEYTKRCQNAFPGIQLRVEMMEDVAHGGFISSAEKIGRVIAPV